MAEMKIVLVCALCRRLGEAPATEDYPTGGNPRRGNAQVTAHSALPRGWSVREREADRLHPSHGDAEPQSRFFCGPRCRTAWENAESAGVDAFREVVRRAGLEMRGAVDALADVAYETPPSVPAYEPPPSHELELPF